MDNDFYCPSKSRYSAARRKDAQRSISHVCHRNEHIPTYLRLQPLITALKFSSRKIFPLQISAFHFINVEAYKKAFNCNVMQLDMIWRSRRAISFVRVFVKILIKVINIRLRKLAVAKKSARSIGATK